MSFLRGRETVLAETAIEKKHGKLHELWRVPPQDEEFAIVDGIIMILETLRDLMLPQAECSWADELQRNHNREIIESALRVIQDLSPKMKAAQTEGYFAAIKVLYDFKGSKDKYLADLEELSQSFIAIHMTHDAAPRWHDLAEWMWALHEVTANALAQHEKDDRGFVKPCEDGTYPFFDAGDGIFKRSTRGISKYTLIRHYGVAAYHIRDRLLEFESNSDLRSVKNNR